MSSVADLVEFLRAHRLLEPGQLEVVVRELQPRFSEPRALVRELVQRSWLTPYQANQVLTNQVRSLRLGPYLLLQRLGEGGMGQVFKARHSKLGRVVALKVIRKEKLDSPDAVRRFHREVRAVAQLSHPNIVHAYDADEVDGIHFFVMEYVDGTDLYQLIKKRGPLPVDEACEYIRQAALGLEHAHQRGLVHRDIKPHNLLVSQSRDREGAEHPAKPLPHGRGSGPNCAVVKLLDLGLARLARSAEEGDSGGTITQEGTVMGTPDYIAPEQTLDSHTADIRADLYSLGCTLYFLLAGRAPFPGGSLGEKLMKHQLREPQPVEELRPEVPPAVAAIVRKLMAKRPEDRHQTAAELAAVLESIVSPRRAAEASGESEVSSATLPMAEPASPLEVLAGSDAHAFTEAVRPAVHSEGIGRYVLIGTAGSLGLLGLLIWGLWPPKPPTSSAPPQAAAPATKPPATSRPKPPPAPRPVDAAWIREVATLHPDRQADSVKKKLEQLNPGFDARQVTHETANGEVIKLNLTSDNLTDLTPLRALPHLQSLTCSGSSQGSGKLADLSPLSGLPLTHLHIGFTRVTDLSPLAKLPLSYLHIASTPVTDLKPLKGMPLTNFHCTYTKVTDLSPLTESPLQGLAIDASAVADLTPLREMRELTHFSCGGTAVRDLSPLRGLPLRILNCAYTPVADLSPLAGMKLIIINCQHTGVIDFTPLRNIPLQTLMCNLSLWSETATLRASPTLEMINGSPVAEFWKDRDAKRAAFDEWAKMVAELKDPDEQVKAVAAKLKELNPGFDGKVESQATDGVVRKLTFCADAATDISPVRALPQLLSLICAGSNQDRGQLADLSPLRGLKVPHLDCQSNPYLVDLTPLSGLPLTYLHVGSTGVTDLTPLTGMPLTYLHIASTRVTDLRPLRRMPLRHLYCTSTKISDLSPLAGSPLEVLACDNNLVSDLTPLREMRSLSSFSCTGAPVRDLTPLRGLPLTALHCAYTPVTDLSPLAGMKLTVLSCQQTGATDLAPLKDLPLQILHCNLSLWADAMPLRGIKTLRELNGTPADEFWRAREANRIAFDEWAKSVAALKDPDEQVKAVADQLKALNPGFDGKVESQTIDGVVRKLAFWTDAVTDISPVRALPHLKSLVCTGTNQDRGRVADLSPLRDHKLTHLWCFSNPRLADLRPLRDLPLEFLSCHETDVADLSPLAGLKLLAFHGRNTRVTDLGPLRDMPLTEVSIPFTPVADLTPLRGCPLSSLDCTGTQVTSLAPLRDMTTLMVLRCSRTKIADLSPLRGTPLKELDCDFDPRRDTELLKSITTLEKINGKPAAVFWKGQ